jgi:hypothetical protein
MLQASEVKQARLHAATRQFVRVGLGATPPLRVQLAKRGDDFLPHLATATHRAHQQPIGVRLAVLSNAFVTKVHVVPPRILLAQSPPRINGVGWHYIAIRANTPCGYWSCGPSRPDVPRRQHRLVLRRPVALAQTMFDPLLAPTKVSPKIDAHSKCPSQGVCGFLTNAIYAVGRGVSSAFYDSRGSNRAGSRARATKPATARGSDAKPAYDAHSNTARSPSTSADTDIA